MDFLTDELECMAVNLAEYNGPELGSEVPLDDIIGEASHHATITSTSGGRASSGNTSSSSSSSSTNGSNGSITTTSSSSNSEYLITAPNLRSLLTHLSSNPSIPPLPPPITGTAEDSTPTLFLRIPVTTKHAIEACLASSTAAPGSRPPTFIRLSTAPEDLSPHSAHPTLGVDAALPQHRGPGRRPHQNEYPVWYFFYGTLADPEKLAGLFDLPEGEERPVLKPAVVHGGRMEMWAGKYRALVDGAERVEGWAYQVQSPGHEGALLVYETEKYEVVRCRIQFQDEEKEVWGCTFRFVDAAYL